MQLIIILISSSVFIGLLLFQNCSGEFEPIESQNLFTSSVKGEPNHILEIEQEEQPQSDHLILENEITSEDKPSLSEEENTMTETEGVSAIENEVSANMLSEESIQTDPQVIESESTEGLGVEEVSDAEHMNSSSQEEQLPEGFLANVQYVSKGFIGPVILFSGEKLCKVKSDNFRQVQEKSTDWMTNIFDHFKVTAENLQSCTLSASVVDNESSQALPEADSVYTPIKFEASLISNNWTELNWVIAESVKKKIDYFKIYRNGVDIAHVNKSYDNKIDEIKWKTNTYIDCNFTRVKNNGCSQVQPEPGSTYSYQISAVLGNKESPKSKLIEVVNPLFHGPQMNLEGYKQVWSDEFNDKKLDSNKWNTKLPWKDPHQIVNSEKQYFVNTQENINFGYNPFKFTDTSLIIEGIRTPEELRPKAKNQPFLSGALTTVGKFNFKYGYVEAKMKLSKTVGSISTFFLLNTKYTLFDDEKPGNEHEIDIVEYLPQYPKTTFQTYHYHRKTSVLERITNSSPTMATKLPDGKNFYNSFHTFAVKWEPQLIVWYIDGKEIKRLSGPSVGWDEVSLFTYLVLGSEWAVTPPANASFPARLEIDYIRVYQKK